MTENKDIIKLSSFKKTIIMVDEIQENGNYQPETCQNAYDPNKVSMYVDQQKNETLMSNYYTIDEINDILDGKIDLDSVYTKDETYNRGELYTREEVEYLLSLKANKVDVYSKIDINALLNLKENLSNKIQEINNDSSHAQYPSAKAVVNYTTDNYGDVIITTSELLTLKNESKLVPGRHYRIIDYKPVFVHNNARWCEHQYDLVVRATSINEFSNKADAMLHDGDNYFSLCNIDNWKLSVDVFCDGSLYEWVKPLYCFKDSEDILLYTLTTDLLLETKLYTETGTEIINETIGSWFGSVEDANNSRLVNGDITTFIVVNEMIDEFENKAGYDFKSVIFNQTHQYISKLYNYGSYYKETIGGINLSTIFLNADRTVAGTCLGLFGTVSAAYASRNVANDITQLIDVKDEFYTFNTSPISTGSTPTVPMDNTVVSGLYSGDTQPHIYSNLNIIEDYYSTQFRLPINAICGTAFKNIFKGSARNTVSEDLHHSEIYENVRNVNIGKGSYEISIGYNTQSVIIGKSSYGIQVGQGITSGTVGSSCKYCVIGDDSDNFVLGNNNDNVIIGKANKLITIDAGCDNTIVEHNNSGITISSNSIGCIIGSKNTNIVIGSGCKNTILGNENYDITIGGGSINCKIGNSSNTISIGNNCSSTTINDNVKTVEIGSNCSNNTILRGGNKIYLKSLENNPTKTTRYCEIGRDADTISLYGCSHSSIGNNTYKITANYIDYSEIGDDCGNLPDLNGLTDIDGNYITPLIYLNVISRVSGLQLINYPEQLAGQLYPTYIVTDKTSHVIPESPNYIKYLVYSLDNGLITGYSTDDNGVTWTEITIGGSGEMLVDILYSELVQMRDSYSLVPGQKYKIVDYTTTTAQANTQSAGHDFDIIVTALSTNELSEIASCVRKSGDTYFENSKLEAWEIKYCIDNDTSRFSWVDAVNGKGVIYYMKDEWGNECPYDFKNIQFKKSNVFLYTFGGTTDDSLTGGCHHNTMMDYMSGSILTLNFNTLGVNSYYNRFGDSCVSNTFGDNFHFNTFGDYCQNNTFGNNCYNNTFGNNCDANTFGNNFGYNTLGISCSSNTFGDICVSNTFGNDCYNNTFGKYCRYNTFGKYCIGNTFYAGTSGTTKKDYIRYIVLEDGCVNNNFYSTLTTSSATYLQRIRIRGLEHTTPTNTQITLPTTNTQYEWVIAKNSSGVVTQYRIEDAPSNDKTYGRKNGNWTQIDTISTTWSALKSLRDTGTLVPGQSYRITNYVCTTTTTNSQAVNNLFDIVVTALDEGHLSENASATYHEGDTYFTNANLEAWEIKYCIDNDTTRFAWANIVNGKGVIYYMKDEWGNECPYDFKNIQFKKSNVFLYTFGGTTDNSLTGGCHHNTMMDYVLNSVLKLNFNTFGINSYLNKFDINCYSNTFGDGCYSNTFGSNCNSNTFGSNCNSNTFGNNCYSNTFGNNCNSNKFENFCSYNTFGYGYNYNTFGDGCQYNTFGNNCNSNTFGNDCWHNNFYHGTSGTTKKDFIKYIVLEDGCTYNNFYSTLTVGYSSYLQRIRIKGLENATATSTIITLPTNTNYEWVIAKNSLGTIKQYCPEDLVP